MRNFINWYSSKKLISIPVTILVAAMIVGGINLGIVNSSKKTEEVTLETNLASANNTYGYTGLVPNEYGWWYVNNGQVDFNYNGLVYDQNVGWWLVRDGAIDFGYNGLYFDQNCGWGLIQGGTVNFGYNGLYCDANCGWWLIQGGTVNFGYNGLYCDANCGWWLIQGGTVGFGYNGLYCDANCGWWLIQGGTVDFGYNGLIPNEYGWWYVQGGAINFNYTGLAYDPYVGWWYVSGGAIDFGYNGIVTNEYGTWYVSGGAVDFNASANLNASSNNSTPARNKQDMGHSIGPEADGNVYCDHLYYDGYDYTQEKYKCTMTTRVDHVLVEPGYDYEEPNIIYGHWDCCSCGAYFEDYMSPEAQAHANSCPQFDGWHGDIDIVRGTVTRHQPDRYEDQTHYIYTCPHCGDKYEL